MRIDLVRRGPPQIAARLGTRRSFEAACAEEVDQEVEAARRRAPDLVQGDGSQLRGPVARLLEELASRGVLQALVALHVAAGQEPRARERPRGLFDDENP